MRLRLRVGAPRHTRGSRTPPPAPPPPRSGDGGGRGRRGGGAAGRSGRGAHPPPPPCAVPPHPPLGSPITRVRVQAAAGAAAAGAAAAGAAAAGAVAAGAGGAELRGLRERLRALRPRLRPEDAAAAAMCARRRAAPLRVRAGAGRAGCRFEAASRGVLSAEALAASLARGGGSDLDASKFPGALVGAGAAVRAPEHAPRTPPSPAHVRLMVGPLRPRQVRSAEAWCDAADAAAAVEAEARAVRGAREWECAFCSHRGRIRVEPTRCCVRAPARTAWRPQM